LIEAAEMLDDLRVYDEAKARIVAGEVKISEAYLSQLEASKRNGTMEVLGRIANVLRVDLEDLAASERQD
jgi:transcriptional regulator with XRE-family HTH domain